MTPPENLYDKTRQSWEEIWAQADIEQELQTLREKRARDQFDVFPRYLSKEGYILEAGSGLGIVLQIATVGFYLVMFLTEMDGAPRPEEMMIVVGAQVGSGVLGVLLRAIVFLGAVKMKNLQNYGLSMAAAIIAIIPCFSACCLLELPFGIWALVVLSNAEVKQAFR